MFQFMFTKKIDSNLLATILLISAGLAIFYNLVYTNGIIFIREPLPYIIAADSALFSENFQIPSSESQLAENVEIEPHGISLERAYSLYKKRKALFIDARDKWDFSEGHIAGSINIPQYKFTLREPQLGEIMKSELLIVYCSEDECDLSRKLAKELIKLDFNRVFVLQEGWEGWKKAGLPFQTSELE